MLVGDAAGFTDPTTWEGIYYAVLSGKLAAEVTNLIMEEGKNFSINELNIYEKKWIEIFGKELKIGKSVQEIVYGSKMEKRMNFLINELKTNSFLYKNVLKNISNGFTSASLIENLPKMLKFLLYVRYKLKGRSEDI